MTATILVLAAVTLLGWSLARARRNGHHGRRAVPRLGPTPFAGRLPQDRDQERLLSDLRALPDARADVRTHLRT